jgi:DNA-binding Lrp family transcriptional regulator
MPLKELDFQILAELMKNAKASDRALAKRLGVSQPTVTRRRARLEEQGIIKEYTVIPDFPKVGYNIMAISLLKYETNVGIDDIREAREKAREIVKDSPFEMIMAERGLGVDYDGVTISFHQDFGAFVKFRDEMRQSLPVKAVKLDTFIVSLSDKLRYRPLTFSTLAQHLQTLHKE